MTKEIKDTRLRELYGHLKPKEPSFTEYLVNDKTFLISMIDDPYRTFKAYGFKGNQQMMQMLHAISEDIRKRAIVLFKDVENVYDNVCDGCDICP